MDNLLPELKFYQNSELRWFHRLAIGPFLSLLVLPFLIVVFALMGALDRGAWLVFGFFVLGFTLFGAIFSYFFFPKTDPESKRYRLELTDNNIVWYGITIRSIQYDAIEQVLVRYKNNEPLQIGVISPEETISIIGYADMALILDELGKRTPKRIPIDHATSRQIRRAMNSRPSGGLRERIRKQRRMNLPTPSKTPYPLAFVMPSVMLGGGIAALLAIFTGYGWTSYFSETQFAVFAVALIIGNLGRWGTDQTLPTRRRLWLGRIVGFALLSAIAVGSYSHLNHALFTSPCRPVGRWMGQTACVRFLNDVEARFVGSGTQMSYDAFNHFYLADLKRWPLAPSMNRQRIEYDFGHKLTVSADGRYALVDDGSSVNSFVHLIDRQTLNTIWIEHDLDVWLPTKLSYSGAFIAYYAHGSHEIEFWDSQTRDVLFTIPSVSGVFANSHNWFAYSVADSSTIVIIDVENQTQVASVQSDSSILSVYDSVHDDVMFANDDNWLMINSEAGTIVIDIMSGDTIGEWSPAFNRRGFSSKRIISPDGAYIILEDNTRSDGGGTHFLAIWDTANQKLLDTIEFVDERPRELSFSADSRYFAVTFDYDTMVFDMNRLKELNTTATK